MGEATVKPLEAMPVFQVAHLQRDGEYVIIVPVDRAFAQRAPAEQARIPGSVSAERNDGENSRRGGPRLGRCVGAHGVPRPRRVEAVLPDDRHGVRRDRSQQDTSWISAAAVSTAETGVIPKDYLSTRSALMLPSSRLSAGALRCDRRAARASAPRARLRNGQRQGSARTGPSLRAGDCHRRRPRAAAPRNAGGEHRLSACARGIEADFPMRPLTLSPPRRHCTGSTSERSSGKLAACSHPAARSPSGVTEIRGSTTPLFSPLCMGSTGERSSRTGRPSAICC